MANSCAGIQGLPGKHSVHQQTNCPHLLIAVPFLSSFALSKWLRDFRGSETVASLLHIAVIDPTTQPTSPYIGEQIKVLWSLDPPKNKSVRQIKQSAFFFLCPPYLQIEREAVLFVILKKEKIVQKKLSHKTLNVRKPGRRRLYRAWDKHVARETSAKAPGIASKMTGSWMWPKYRDLAICSWVTTRESPLRLPIRKGCECRYILLSPKISGMLFSTGRLCTTGLGARCHKLCGTSWLRHGLSQRKQKTEN